MSVNRDLPHVFVLPEDDANRQLANGFWLQVDSTHQRKMRVLRVAGGWNEVLNLFESEHAKEMNRFPCRFMVLLIDFDNDGDRLRNAKARIPPDLMERVFILGAWSEPEDLKRAKLGALEIIGMKLAEDCREGTDATWGHDLLRHNAGEIDRLRQHVRPILFS
jgi:hypothetical protein